MLSHYFWLIANLYSGQGTPTLVPSERLERRFQLTLPATSKYPKDINRLKFAVHLHVYYKEEATVIINSILDTCVGADLYITYSDPHVREFLDSYCMTIGFYGILNYYEYILVQNIGRNVVPLLDLVERILCKYSVVLHMHTKKSPHFDGGNLWAKHLTSCLVHHKLQVQSILSGFAKDSQLGLVMPTAYQPIRPYLGWGGNFSLAKSLAMQLDPPIKLSYELPLLFSAGMMFWFRPVIFSSLAEVYKKSNASISEPLPEDGTILHAIERLIVFVCESKGFKWAYSSPGTLGCNVPVNSSNYNFSVLEPQPVLYQVIRLGLSINALIKKFRIRLNRLLRSLI